MAQELKVKIGADISDFTSQVSKAGTALSNGFVKNVQKAEGALDSLSPAVGDLSKKVSGNSDEIVKNTSKQVDNERSAKSLKAQLRALKEEMFALESAGKQNTEQYKKLEAESGRLADRLGDQSNTIKTLASDTFALDAAVQSVSVVASAWQAYEGVVQLSGRSTEDVQKSIQKIMAVMAVANGIQQVGNFLTGQSAAKKVLDTVATYAQSAAYRVLGASAATASVSMRTFTAALAGTGIGIILVAIGAAANALLNLGSSAESTSDKAKGLNDTIKGLIDSIKTLSELKIIPEAQTAAQISEVNALAKAVTDSTLSDQQKGNAIDRLKKISQDYFGDLKLQNVTVQSLTDKVNAYSKSLVSTNKQNLLKDDINNAKELSLRLNEIVSKRKEEEAVAKKAYQAAYKNLVVNNAPENIRKEAAALKKYRAAIEATNAAKIEAGKVSPVLDDRIKKLNEEVIVSLTNLRFKTDGKEIDESVIDLRKKLQDKVKEAINEGIKLPPVNIFGSKEQLETSLKNVEKTITNQLELRKKVVEYSKEALDKEIEATKTSLEQKKELNQQNTADYTNLQNRLFTLSSLRIDKEYNAEKDSILKLGNLRDPLVQKALDDLQKVYDSKVLKIKAEIYVQQFEVNFKEGSNLSSGLAKTAADRFKGIGNIFPTSNDFKQQEVDYFGSLVNAIQTSWAKTKPELAKSFEAIKGDYSQQLMTAYDNFKQAALNAPVDAFVAVGEALGSLLEEGIGGSLAKAAESVLKIIGGVLKQLGVYIITAAESIKVMRAAINKMLGFPQGSIAAGILLVAIGTLLSSVKLQSKKPIQAFAEGGIVTSPMLGMVGEAGREAIIPLSRFDEVVGSRGATDVFVTGMLSGEMIFLQQQRAIKRRDRVV